MVSCFAYFSVSNFFFDELYTESNYCFRWHCFRSFPQWNYVMSVTPFYFLRKIFFKPFFQRRIKNVASKLSRQKFASCGFYLGMKFKFSLSLFNPQSIIFQRCVRILNSCLSLFLILLKQDHETENPSTDFWLLRATMEATYLYLTQPYPSKGLGLCLS
jgi:hypothetical protein